MNKEPTIELPELSAHGQEVFRIVTLGEKLHQDLEQARAEEDQAVFSAITQPEGMLKCGSKEYTGPLRYYAGFKWRIYELQTRKDVLQYYLDMNAGGTPHAESEIARVRKLLKKEVLKAPN